MDKRITVWTIVIGIFVSAVFGVLATPDDAGATEDENLILSYSDGNSTLRWDTLQPNTYNATAANSIILTNNNSELKYRHFEMHIDDLAGDPNNLPMRDNYYVEVYENGNHKGTFYANGSNVTFDANLNHGQNITVTPVIKRVYSFCNGPFTGTFEITGWNGTADTETGSTTLSITAAPAISLSYTAGQTELTYGTRVSTATNVYTVNDLRVTNSGNTQISQLDFTINSMTSGAVTLITFGNTYINEVGTGTETFYDQTTVSITISPAINIGGFRDFKFKLVDINVPDGPYTGTFTVTGWSPLNAPTPTETGNQEITINAPNVVLTLSYNTIPDGSGTSDTALRFGTVNPGAIYVISTNYFILKNEGNVPITSFNMAFTNLNDGAKVLQIHDNAAVLSEDNNEYTIPGSGMISFSLNLDVGDTIAYLLRIDSIPSNQLEGSYSGSFTVTGTYNPSDTVYGSITTSSINPDINIQYTDGDNKLKFESVLEPDKQSENDIIVTNNNIEPIVELWFYFDEPNPMVKFYIKDGLGTRYDPDSNGNIYVSQQVGVGHLIYLKVYVLEVGAGYDPSLNYTFQYRVAANMFGGSSYSYNETLAIIGGSFVSYTLQLGAGWNLVSIPLLNTGIENASDLAQHVGISQVAQYNPASHSFDHYIKELPSQSTDFSVQNDYGYWVLATAPVSLTVSGEQPTQRTISFVQGWNLIGWTSLANTDAAALANLSSHIIQCINYNENNEFEYYLADVPGQSVNFQVVDGRGYWLLTDQATTITYGGG